MGHFSYFVVLTMLFSIWLRILLPVVNPHSVELEPGHSHIVIGAKNAQEVEQALYEHMHGEQPLDNHPSDHSTQSHHPAAQSKVNVVSLATAHDSQTTMVGLDAQVWIVSGSLPFVHAPDGLLQILSHSLVFPAGNLVLPQEQPPETSH